MENAADERIKSLEEENRDLKSALKEKDAARKTHEALIEQLRLVRILRWLEAIVLHR